MSDPPLMINALPLAGACSLRQPGRNSRTLDLHEKLRPERGGSCDSGEEAHAAAVICDVRRKRLRIAQNARDSRRRQRNEKQPVEP